VKKSRFRKEARIFRSFSVFQQQVFEVVVIEGVRMLSLSS